MPTPSIALPVAAVESPGVVHATCPPEGDRVVGWRTSSEESTEQTADDESHPAPPPVDEHKMHETSAVHDGSSSSNTSEIPHTSSSNLPQSILQQEQSLSPQYTTPKPEETISREDHISVVPSSPAPVSEVIDYKPDKIPNYEFSTQRLLPNHTSSFLHAGSKFTGTQQSDRQIYNVDVEIKHVDMAESFLCGYLRIQGLTEDHPTLTTYFEGEIIGDKHTFQTRHESWGATDKTDMQHWARFPAWRPLAKAAKKPDFHYKNFAQRENIFMRWKEYFLVPDHRVRTINGASFEGFYYICFNQIAGKVSGIYFHSRSEKYQQLELKHVDDKGCFAAMEFR